MKFLTVACILVTCGVALAAPSYYHDKGVETKYVVVTKHGDSSHQHGWDAGKWGNHGAAHGGYVVVADGHHYDSGDYHDKHAKYEFDYGVKDLKTGDIKNQWEHRDGDHVKGSYSLKEADGTTRVVEYTADDHNGFNAVVKKIGHAVHPDVYSKPVVLVNKWEGANGYEGHGYEGHGYEGHNHGYDHGHATSYVKIKQH